MQEASVNVALVDSVRMAIEDVCKNFVFGVLQRCLHSTTSRIPNNQKIMGK